MPRRPQRNVFYKNVVSWAKIYGQGGNPDQKCVETFMECEATEAVSGLRAELASIAQGKYDDAGLDKTIGAARRLKYGSYAQWAKTMLLWMASYKR